MVSTAQPLKPHLEEGTIKLEDVQMKGRRKISVFVQLPYKEAVNREHRAG